MNLRNYLEPEAYKQIPTTMEDRAKVNTPILPPNIPQTEAGLLQKILEALLALARGVANAFLRAYLQPGRAARWFIKQGTGSVVSGTPLKVISFQISEKFSGAILHIGIDSGALPSDVTWTLRINGSDHPGFQDLKFFSPTLATPIPFQQELCQGRTVELWAKSSNAVATTVAATFIGYQTMLRDGDDYGSTPANGIG